MLALGLALLAGLVTVASPCILPMLPVLLSAAWGRSDPRRPLWIVTGFVATFAATAFAFGLSTRVLGVSQGTLRSVAILALLAFGLLSIFPRVFEWIAPALAPLADRGMRLGQHGGDGALGALALGASLGALWTPCAGPVLASILALVVTAREPWQAGPLLLAYALGAGVPMLAIAYGGQRISSRMGRVARHAARIRQAFGVLVLATALAMLWNYDVVATAWISERLPRLPQL